MTQPTDQPNSDASTAKVISPSISEVDHKTAQRYLDIAKTTISQTSTVGILWLVAIIVAWWSIELEMWTLKGQMEKAAKIVKTTYSTLAQEERKKIAQGQAFDIPHSFSKDRRYLPMSDDTQGHVAISKEDSKSSNTRALTQKDGKCESIDCYEARSDKKYQKYAEVKGGTVEFNLPTFSKFKVPTQVAPLVLVGIILLLAIYMTFMRMRAFRYVSRGLQIYKADTKTPLQELGDILAPRSWWIAPLPGRPGECVLPEEFASCLGWSNPKEASRVLVALFWLTLFLIQIRLVTSGSYFIQEIIRADLFIKSIEEAINLEHSKPVNHALWVLVGMYWMFFGMTISLGVRWFWPGAIPDAYQEPRIEICRSRRTFLIHATVGVALAIVMSSNLPKTLSMTLSHALPHVRRPRYRKKRVTTTVKETEDGLLLNPKSGVIHAHSHGHVVGLSYPKGSDKKANVEKWKPLNNVALLLPVTSSKHYNSTTRASCGIPVHMNKDHVSIITELAFFRALDSEQYQTALAIVIGGIEQDIVCKRRAGHIIAIDAETERPVRKSRLKPRKRRKSTQKFMNNWSSINERYVPRVSIKLYDSLARAAVEKNKPDWLKEMLTRIDRHKLRGTFESRITKWTDPNSEWYRGITKQGRSSNVG